MASRYSAEYDEALLSPYLSKDDFTYVIGNLNSTLTAYWPCSFSVWLGYILSPFTLGFSFFIPNLCIADARENLIK